MLHISIIKGAVDQENYRAELRKLILQQLDLITLLFTYGKFTYCTKAANLTFLCCTL